MKRETWKMTAVRDLREGDVIETPGNGASERVTFHEQAHEGGDWYRYGVTGNDDRMQSGSTKVWKLFK